MFECRLALNKYQEETVKTAVYLLIRSPTKIQDVTPKEAWFRRKLQVGNMKVFAPVAYVIIPYDKMSS